MSELQMRKLVKIYPYTKPTGLFGRKRAKEALEREKAEPYTTNEGVVAVQDFSLNIADSEFVVLLGSSGCGKTTVLRMIAGLESVSDGEILMDGEVINDLPPENRDIAMIFQNYALYPGFTVYENLAYPLKNRHMPREEIDKLVAETAELLEITELLDRRPAELSGGQRQRVAIGRALVRKPKLFLMDEPFSNLDGVLRQKLREEVKRIHKKLGTTFIYVTHDQAEAFGLGERIVLMRDGLIEQVGTPGELYLEPKNLYTAMFIGAPQMNLIYDAVLRRAYGGWQAEALGGTYTLPREKTAGLSGSMDGARVILGIRPANIAVSKDGLDATVDYADIIETELHIHMRAGDCELTAVTPATSYGNFMRGQDIKISLNANRIYLFSSDTKMRIV